MTIRDVTDEVLRSKKYSKIDRDVIDRISAETIPRYARQRDVVKAVKKKLHIINASFLPDVCHAKAQAYLETFSGDSLKTNTDFASSIMALHVSTNERLGQAAEIYEYICKFVKAADSIIDIGCGFNPFALAFFTVLPKSYHAFDISSSTIDVLNKFFRLAGLPYTAQLCDVVAQRPAVYGDVLFMFKLFPILEQQKEGCAFDILKSLNCHTSIVSFPLKSASGREKGMEAFYAAKFESGLPSGFAIVDKTVFENEMFYVVEKVENVEKGN